MALLPWNTIWNVYKKYVTKKIEKRGEGNQNKYKFLLLHSFCSQSIYISMHQCEAKEEIKFNVIRIKRTITCMM